MNEITAIVKQLEYMEKRATKNIHEVWLSRSGTLSKETVDYFKNDENYKIIFTKKNFFDKGTYIITKYIHREV